MSAHVTGKMNARTILTGVLVGLWIVFIWRFVMVASRFGRAATNNVLVWANRVQSRQLERAKGYRGVADSSIVKQADNACLGLFVS